jgi:hypothetical protein
MSHDWNPYNDKDAEPLERPAKDWNFDFRNQSFYLGKVNENGDNDLNMRYYTDEKTGRYYRKGEIVPKAEPEKTAAKPFINNSYEGERKKNFSFSLPEFLKGKKK